MVSWEKSVPCGEVIQLLMMAIGGSCVCMFSAGAGASGFNNSAAIDPELLRELLGMMSLLANSKSDG
jgi:hypothetical protein